MDAQLVARKLNEAFSNDDLWTSPSIVDDVEDLADEYDVLKAENDELKAKVLWLEVTLVEMASERYGVGDLIEHINSKIAGKIG